MKRLLQVYAAAAGVIAVVAVAVQAAALPTSAWGWLDRAWSAVSVGLTGAAAVLWLVGETALFPAACRHHWLCGIFPDLDGEWEGELRSNWPRVARRGGEAAEPAPLLARPATVKIKARLLSVSMFLDTKDAYSDSRTIVAGVAKDRVSERCCLTYVYENTTPNPEQTDAGSHLGAAVLTLKEENGEAVLDGPYWTNRNWTKGLNTAGLARFRKVR